LSQVTSGAPVGRDVETAKREAQHKRIADSIVENFKKISCLGQNASQTEEVEY
jgi:hypothetical protein